MEKRKQAKAARAPSGSPVEIDGARMGETLRGKPAVALSMLSQLAALGICPTQAGVSRETLKTLPAEALGQRLSPSAQKERLAQLEEMTEAMLKNASPDCDAWLEGLSRAKLTGSVEKPSRWAIEDPDSELGERLDPEALKAWIGAGMLMWSYPESAAEFSLGNPGALDGELGVRVFARLIPGGLSTYGAFSPDRAVESMKKAGVLFKLAAKYKAGNREGFAEGLVKTLNKDTMEQLKRRGSPRASGDPAYDKLLEWSLARVRSKTDAHVKHLGRIHREDDFEALCVKVFIQWSAVEIERQALAGATLGGAKATRAAPRL